MQKKFNNLFEFFLPFFFLFFIFCFILIENQLSCGLKGWLTGKDGKERADYHCYQAVKKISFQ